MGNLLDKVKGYYEGEDNKVVLDYETNLLKEKSDYIRKQELISTNNENKFAAPELEQIEEYRFKMFNFKQISINPDNRAWPRPRSGHRIVCNENTLYLYGGYNPKAEPGYLSWNLDDDWHCSRPVFRELWEFNLTKSKWNKLPAVNVPYVLASNALVLQGSLLMVYGGTGVPFGGHCSNLLYVCNLKDDMPLFEEVQVVGELPEPQYGQAVFIRDKYLYTVGGTNGYDYTSTIHKLNMKTGQWDLVHSGLETPNDPSGRYRHELGLQLYKSKIYMIGGGTALFPCDLQDIPVFDLVTNQWTHMVTHGDPNVNENNGYPERRSFHSLVQFPDGNDVFICGGECGSHALSDSWKLNLTTGQWTKLPDLLLPSPRFFHSSALSPQGKMYVFGGVLSLVFDYPASTTMERTNELLEAWICIPKLSEMCWEALKHYKFFKLDLSSIEVNKLLPKKFANRLSDL